MNRNIINNLLIITAAVFVAALAAKTAPAEVDPFQQGQQSSKPPSAQQVSVEMRMIEISRAAADELFKEQGGLAGAYALSPQTLEALGGMVLKGGAKIISQSKVITKSGANSQNKAVREIIYPTEYVFSASGATNNSAIKPAGSYGSTGQGHPAPGALVPMSFETRDCGTCLDVTPVIGPDKETIDICCLFQRVRLSSYPGKIKGEGMGGNIDLEQPVFLVEEVTSQFSVKSGATVLVSVCDATPDRDQNSAGSGKQEAAGDNIILFIMAACVVPPH